MHHLIATLHSRRRKKCSESELIKRLPQDDETMEHLKIFAQQYNRKWNTVVNSSSFSPRKKTIRLVSLKRVNLPVIDILELEILPYICICRVGGLSALECLAYNKHIGTHPKTECRAQDALMT